MTQVFINSELLEIQFVFRFDGEVPLKWLHRVFPIEFYNVCASPKSNCRVVGAIEADTGQLGRPSGYYWNDEWICEFSGFDSSEIRGIESMIQSIIARIMSPDFLFLHSGAVAVNSGGLLLPGSTHSGKSTLTVALAGNGAVYYSDDCAIIGPDLKLYPYPIKPKIRGHHGEIGESSHSEAVYASGAEGVDVRLIAFTRYVSGSDWTPLEISSGAAVWRLMKNLFDPQVIVDNPKKVIERLVAVTRKAELIATPRGEAELAARALLAYFGR